MSFGVFSRERVEFMRREIPRLEKERNEAREESADQRREIKLLRSSIAKLQEQLADADNSVRRHQESCEMVKEILDRTEAQAKSAEQLLSIAESLLVAREMALDLVLTEDADQEIDYTLMRPDPCKHCGGWHVAPERSCPRIKEVRVTVAPSGVQAETGVEYWAWDQWPHHAVWWPTWPQLARAAETVEEEEPVGSSTP